MQIVGLPLLALVGAAAIRASIGVAESLFVPRPELHGPNQLTSSVTRVVSERGFCHIDIQRSTLWPGQGLVWMRPGGSKAWAGTMTEAPCLVHFQRMTALSALKVQMDRR